MTLQSLSPDWHADCSRIVTIHNLSGLDMEKQQNADGVRLDWILGLTLTVKRKARDFE